MTQATIHQAKTHLSRLIQQALSEGSAIVSRDAVFDRYGVRRVW